MIRGRFLSAPGRLRPFLIAGISIPSQAIVGDAYFLVDTGADSTVLAPADALALGIDTAQLLPAAFTAGVGGRTETASVEATLVLGNTSHDIRLRILTPRTVAQRRALARIPSLLGRDILSRFALFMEERSGRILLLEPGEVARLHLP